MKLQLVHRLMLVVGAALFPISVLQAWSTFELERQQISTAQGSEPATRPRRRCAGPMPRSLEFWPQNSMTLSGPAPCVRPSYVHGWDRTHPLLEG